MKKKRARKPEHFRIEIHRDSTLPWELDILADALVFVHGDAALDAALNLAHNINQAAHQCNLERRLLEAQADTLQSQLEAIEEQLRAGRKP